MVVAPAASRCQSRPDGPSPAASPIPQLDAAARRASNGRMQTGRCVVDVHTHAFPDALAARAVAHLERRANVRAALDGTAGALAASMDRAGIALSVVCSVATGPAQFEPILRWCAAIASPRLVPFPSVHPGARDPVDEVRRVAAAG